MLEFKFLDLGLMVLIPQLLLQFEFFLALLHLAVKIFHLLMRLDHHPLGLCLLLLTTFQFRLLLLDMEVLLFTLQFHFLQFILEGALSK